MTTRTTEAMLRRLCERLNVATGMPLLSYQPIMADGPFEGRNVACIGNYHLDFSYGGVSVVQMVNESGGVRHALGMYGSTTKAECERHLRAALWMLEEAQPGAAALKAAVAPARSWGLPAGWWSMPRQVGG